jgi:excisionase family DNA binding protein
MPIPLHLANAPLEEWPDLLTPTEVSLIFGVDPKTVTRWAQSGRIHATRTLGGHRRFPRQDVWDAREKHNP